MNRCAQHCDLMSFGLRLHNIKLDRIKLIKAKSDPEVWPPDWIALPKIRNGSFVERAFAYTGILLVLLNKVKIQTLRLCHIGRYC